MVKKFTTNCDFSGKKVPVTFYIGDPAKDCESPISFQGKWVSERGGIVPPEVNNSFNQLKKISDQNRLSFEDLCEHVMQETKANKTLAQDAKQATALAEKESVKSEIKQENPKPVTTETPAVQRQPEVKKENPKVAVSEEIKQTTVSTSPPVPKQVNPSVPEQARNTSDRSVPDAQKQVMTKQANSSPPVAEKSEKAAAPIAQDVEKQSEIKKEDPTDEL